MSKELKLNLPSATDLFSTEETRQDAKLERVLQIAPEELNPFRDHPFQVNHDAELQKLIDSIRDSGIMSPLIARPRADGGYELISGHRRKAAAEILGIDKLPVLVRDMTDDEAVILMVDSNIQRENLLPSEKAFAYKMKLEAMKRQGKRTDLTSPQLAARFRSDDELAKSINVSGDTIRRYIRLTELAKPILELVDKDRIAFSPAVELSYLTKQEQAELWDIMQANDATPSLSQAVRMKKLSQEVKLTPEVIYAVMSEEKPNQKEQVRFQTDKLRQYFPKGYTAEHMEKAIFKLLEERKRKLDKQRDDVR